MAKQKLLTKADEKRIPALYSTENIPDKEKKIAVKFFNPCGSQSWYVVEGQKTDEDWLFFGYVDSDFPEFGYFTLLELQSVRLPWGLKIERDMYFENKKIGDVYRD